MKHLTFLIVIFFIIQTLDAQSLEKLKLDALAIKYARQSLPEYREFLSIPCDAHFPADLEKNRTWIENAFRKRNFTIKRLPTKGFDLVLAERQHKGATKTVLFYVQVDGQPVDPTKWEQPHPFTPVLKKPIVDGKWEIIPWESLDGEIDMEWRVFARAAADAKGPINMLLAALDAIAEAGLSPNYNMKIIMDFEEELGSPNLPDAVKVHRDALKSDMLVILDGPMHVSNKPTLVFGARGIATMRLTTFGPRVPQHSGHYGNYAPNPALLLAQLLASMKDDNGRVIIPGYYDGVELSDDVKKILAQTPDSDADIMRKLGIAEFDNIGNNYQESIQYPSLNIRGLSSGWVGSQARTIVPDVAVANLDIRLVKESDPERLIKLIRKHIEAQGFHIIENEPTEEERLTYPKLVSMGYDISYAAFRTDYDTEIGQWLDRAYTRTFGSSPIRIRTGGGSIPISPFVTTLGIPAVIAPSVNADDNQHSPNENLRLGNYFEGVRAYMGILVEPLK
ncbi:MAG: M20/M25/M40 family metallo-hydrolase [Saprospiraceae bacterium]|nr:M20/M25/M40 family metallo-hydrolase [Saprospiraceae bacterium]